MIFVTMMNGVEIIIGAFDRSNSLSLCVMIM